MDLTVNLNFQKTAIVDGKTVLALPDTLTVHFASNIYELDELVVVVKNGLLQCMHKVKDRTLDLTDYLRAGKIEMTVCLVAKGTKCKEWNVVPIILQEIDGKLHVFDEIAECRALITAEEEKRKEREHELLAMIAMLEKAVENLHAEIYQTEAAHNEEEKEV